MDVKASFLFYLVCVYVMVTLLDAAEKSGSPVAVAVAIMLGLGFSFVLNKVLEYLP